MAPTEGRVGGTEDSCITLRGFERGFAGATIEFSYPSFVTPESVSLNPAFGFGEASIDGNTVRVRVSDTEDAFQRETGEFRLGCVTLRCVEPGEGVVEVSPERIDNDDGAPVEVTPAEGCGTIVCRPESECPTVDGVETTDPDGDGLCEDLNGNERTDFDDVNVFFEEVSNSEGDVVGADAFDFNGNGRTDFDDVNTLFDEVS